MNLLNRKLITLIYMSECFPFVFPFFGIYKNQKAVVIKSPYKQPFSMKHVSLYIFTGMTQGTCWFLFEERFHAINNETFPFYNRT